MADKVVGGVVPLVLVGGQVGLELVVGLAGRAEGEGLDGAAEGRAARRVAADAVPELPLLVLHHNARVRDLVYLES